MTPAMTRLPVNVALGEHRVRRRRRHSALPGDRRAVAVVQTGTPLELGIYAADGFSAPEKVLHPGEPAPDRLGSFVFGQASFPTIARGGAALVGQS